MSGVHQISEPPLLCRFVLIMSFKAFDI
jgi:hypothetical protein